MRVISVTVDAKKMSLRKQVRQERKIRENLLETVFDLVINKEWNAELICMPGGYFNVSNNNARDSLAAWIEKLVKLKKIKLAIGIDVGISSNKTKNSKNYGYLYGPKGFLIGPVLQVSYSVRQGRGLDPKKIARPRTSNGIAVAVCAEVISEIFWSEISKEKPKLMVGLAHASIPTGNGPRSWERPLNKFQKKYKIPIILAEHVGGARPSVHLVWPHKKCIKKSPLPFPGKQRCKALLRLYNL